MELELLAMFSLELDSVRLLELAVSELVASVLDVGTAPAELFSSGLPQPSGGQTTPYAG